LLDRSSPVGEGKEITGGERKRKNRRLRGHAILKLGTSVMGGKKKGRKEVSNLHVSYQITRSGRKKEKGEGGTTYRRDQRIAPLRLRSRSISVWGRKRNERGRKGDQAPIISI